nr:unnamed protein product [Digitaria exilis]
MVLLVAEAEAAAVLVVGDGRGGGRPWESRGDLCVVRPAGGGEAKLPAGEEIDVAGGQSAR